MSQLNVDLELVRKYNVSGPRYTSYPPANCFSDEIGWGQIAEEILENNRGEDDFSLYFHIPFCESLCWYCGCNTVITTQKQDSATYLTYLEKEVAQTKAILNSKRQVVQLHMGGGTPTFLPPDQLRRLGSLIHARFHLAEKLEAGVEIDPRRLSYDHLAALKEIGFNRVSLGVQDFDPAVQAAVHRVQPFERTKEALEWSRSLGFQSVNIDLMYGLPHQSVDSFARTLNQALALNPDRFAVFNYAHVPWLKPTQKLLESALPAPEIKLQLLKLVIETLTGAGYLYIGMDHFAKPDDPLARAQSNGTLQRNFQGYSTCGGADIYAFGLSAISQTTNVYWQNHKDRKAYYSALDSGKSPIAKGFVTTEDDRIRRETIMRLMCDLCIDFEAMSQKLGLNFTSYFSPELDSLSELEADGLVEASSAVLKVTNPGRLFLRNIAMKFDGARTKDNQRQFSKTI